MPDFLPMIPTDDDTIRAAAWRSQRHVARQALLSAGATFVPIPGVDMLVDISVMMSMANRASPFSNIERFLTVFMSTF